MCALERGKIDSILDMSAGGLAKKLADLSLNCHEKDSMDRPDTVLQVWHVVFRSQRISSVPLSR